MATRDATCIAPGFGTGNGREKMKKRENGIWGPKTGKWDGIWGYFPVFPFFFKPLKATESFHPRVSLRTHD